MPAIRFIYSSDKYDKNRELVLTNVIDIVANQIELPKNIEVQFVKLNDSIYGETTVDPRFKSRIKLHEDLSAKECIVPTIHELLHLCQIHIGQLSGRRDGSYLWEGKVYPRIDSITLEQWKSLPWERDVAEKQQKLLEKVLKIGLGNG